MPSVLLRVVLLLLFILLLLHATILVSLRIAHLIVKLLQVLLCPNESTFLRSMANTLLHLPSVAQERCFSSSLSERGLIALELTLASAYSFVKWSSRTAL